MRNNFLVFLVLFFAFFGHYGLAYGQNSYCKTGSDASLPVIKIKINNMKNSLTRQKTQIQNLRAPLEPLKDEILALDAKIKPMRSNHQKAAKKAQKSAKSYEKYKQKWLDTGELDRLNSMIKSRKQKHAIYKQKRREFISSNEKFKALAKRYEQIARDMLDKNRDCQAASNALRQSGF